MAKQKQLYKQILAGRFKGKKLLLPPKHTTRSSKSIVLGSLFDTLQGEIVGALFVELFSGSGSVGLEALSRGAKGVIFMERSKEALAILRKNIDALLPNACEVYAGDSFDTIADVIKRLKAQDERAIFYIDPPFSYRKGFEDIYDRLLDLVASLPSKQVQMVIFEHMSSLVLPQKIGDFELIKQRRFGKTTLSYYS